ncbi:helix-turn-helix domain-containing protein [Rheinheimera sp.]|uniref:AraC family transcriptional regulator n=1 Tax=Rheinheimera sp. TaxID=1869214 RepID=UPI003D2654FD
MRRPGGYQDKQLLVAHGVPELLQAAQRRGASLHQLLAGTTLFEADLQKPQFRIHAGALQRLLCNLNKVPSPELPAVIAQAILLNPQIPVCRLILSAPTLGKALRYLWFYRQQLWPLCLPVLQWQGATLRLTLLPAVGMGAVQELALAVCQQFVLALCAARQVRCGNATQSVAPLLLQLTSAQLAQRLEQEQRAECRHWRQICCQQAKLLPRQPGLLEWLSRQQLRRLPDWLSPDEAAAILQLHPAALKRLLAEQHCSFSQWQDLLRNQLALFWLSQPELSNRQLAARLGYSDEHNFRRAVKRWTGLLPSAFRPG